MPLAWRSRHGVLAALAFPSAMAGCALVAGLHDRVLESGSEGGAPAEGGAPGDATIGSDAGDALRSDAIPSDATPFDALASDTLPDTMPTLNQPDAACDGSCCVIYVSLTGMDTASGCDASAPKRTIASAVAAAAEAGAAPEVWICEGTYAEMNLTITAPVPVFGGLDCQTWGWPEGFGYPFEAGPPGTIIEMANESDAGATITIVGPWSGAGDAAAVPPQFPLQGLTVAGPDGGSDLATVYVTGADVLFSDDMIVGGVGNGQTGTTYAVLLSDAPSDITKTWTTFHGSGAATGLTVGLGIGLSQEQTATVSVHGNRIEGGSSTSSDGSGSTGILVSTTSATSGQSKIAIADNDIFGGLGVAAQWTLGTVSSIGVSVAGPVDVELSGNTIQGGQPQFGGAAGVVVGSATNVTLAANRIYGGIATNGSTTGVAVSNPLAFWAYDNMIHGGNVQDGNTSGITCVLCAGSFIEDNTIFAGVPAMGTNAFALSFTGGGSSNVVEGNILAGAPSTSQVGTNADISVDQGHCEELGVLDKNLFLDGQLLVGCGMGTDVDAVQVELMDAGEEASGNLTLEAHCVGADPAMGLCMVDTACAPTCLAGLVTWDTKDAGLFGEPSVLTPGGWELLPGAPCAVAKGGIDLSSPDAGPPVTTDINDALRPDDASSFGAAQFPADATCTN